MSAKRRDRLWGHAWGHTSPHPLEASSVWDSSAGERPKKLAVADMSLGVDVACERPMGFGEPGHRVEQEVDPLHHQRQRPSCLVATH